MPRELVAMEPRKPVLRSYTEIEPGPGEVRVLVEYGAPKHGSEMQAFQGVDPFLSSRLDPEMLLFLDDDTAKSKPFYLELGNICVGVVSDLGPGVTDVKEGQRVAIYRHLRETHVVKTSSLLLMNDRMTWKEAVCYDPSHFALAGIRDGHVRVGDAVAVFGLGAIGLLTAQLAKIAGASFVAVIDPIAKRREAALKCGADLAIDPMSEDAGLQLKLATGKRGVDVAIETSASYAALQQAIRGVAYGGNVAVVGWYQECKGGLNLGREAHFNQPNLIFSRAVSSPNRDYPRWDWNRTLRTCWTLLEDGRLRCEEIVDPVVPFAQSAEAYLDIERHPEKSVKLGVSFV